MVFCKYMFKNLGIPAIIQQKQIQLVSLASPSGLGIWHCGELWFRSQTLLGCWVAMPVCVASSCSSNWTPSLWTSICYNFCPKKQKKKSKTKIIIYICILMLNVNELVSVNYFMYYGVFSNFLCSQKVDNVMKTRLSLAFQLCWINRKKNSL